MITAVEISQKKKLVKRNTQLLSPGSSKHLYHKNHVCKRTEVYVNMYVLHSM